MKVVVFPGVGFNSNKQKHNEFAEKIKKYSGLDMEISTHYWLHNFDVPDINLPYKSWREWIYEVMLDFQQIVKHALEMKVPEADYYMGHSAGSILALVQKKPCIMFGSPAFLVECIRDASIRGDDELIMALRSNDRNVLNVINKYDQLAYYLDHEHVDNYVYSNAWLNLNTYNPIAAHYDYWDNKKVIKKMVEQLKKWEEK